MRRENEVGWVNAKNVQRETQARRRKYFRLTFRLTSAEPRVVTNNAQPIRKFGVRRCTESFRPTRTPKIPVAFD